MLFNSTFSAKSTFIHHFVSFCRVRRLILVDFAEPSIVFCRIFAPRMNTTERQKLAREMASQYLCLLVDHENELRRMVRQTVDERLVESRPSLESLIDERIRQKLELKNK